MRVALPIEVIVLIVLLKSGEVTTSSAATDVKGKGRAVPTKGSIGMGEDNGKQGSNDDEDKDKDNNKENSDSDDVDPAPVSLKKHSSKPSKPAIIPIKPKHKEKPAPIPSTGECAPQSKVEVNAHVDIQDLTMTK